MSPIRSILLHADATTVWAERLGYAAGIARMFDADLTTVYATDSMWTQHPLAMVESPDAAAILSKLEEQRRRQARAAYDQAASALGGRLHWKEPAALSSAQAVTGHAFCADLLILAQRPPAGDPDGGVERHFVESVVMDSGRPALVVPYIGPPTPTGVVLVAWKDTRESARALSAAIPFLQRAKRVFVATWREADDETSGADVAGYLRCHGIEATLKPGGDAPSSIGDALLSLAVDVSADLLVMGCYGHSRARERVLGGATRSILEAMTVPVLMAH